MDEKEFKKEQIKALNRLAKSIEDIKDKLWLLS